MGLFSIIARLTMDTAGFDSGARKAESRATQMAGRIGASIKGQLAAAFSVAAIAQMTKLTVEFVGKMKDLSDQIGVSVEEMQKLDYAARMTGTSIDPVVQSLARLGKLRAEVLGGKQEQAAGILAGMGISRDRLEVQSVMETFRQIADFVSKNDLGNDRGAVMQVLFGRSGEELLGLFKDGFQELSDEVERFGGVLSGSTVDAIDQLGKAWDRVKTKARSGFAELLNDAILFAKVTAGIGKPAGMSRKDYMTMLRTKAALDDTPLPSGGDRNVDPFADQNERVEAIRRALMGGGGSAGASTAPRTSTSVSTLGQGSLAAVGGFVGLGGSRDVQVEVLRKIAKATAETAQNTRALESQDLDI